MDPMQPTPPADPNAVATSPQPLGTPAQLLEAKNNLQRMLTAIPLTDDERAAVDDGHDAVDALLARLHDVPTPAGPSPQQIGTRPAVTLLPIVQITQRNTR